MSHSPTYNITGFPKAWKWFISTQDTKVSDQIFNGRDFGQMIIVSSSMPCVSYFSILIHTRPKNPAEAHWRVIGIAYDH